MGRAINALLVLVLQWCNISCFIWIIWFILLKRDLIVYISLVAKLCGGFSKPSSFILALECGLLLVGGVICIPFYAQTPHMHRHLRDAQIPQMHRHPFWNLKGVWVLVGLKVQESHNYSHARGKDTQVWSTLQSLNEHQGDTAPLLPIVCATYLLTW